MAAPAPRKPHGDQCLVDPLPSGQRGETDTPVPETVTPRPGSCILPRTVSRVPCPKCCAWLLHSTTRVWQTPEWLVIWGPSFQRRPSPQHFWGSSTFSAHPYPQPPPCPQSRPSLRGTSRMPASQRTVPREDLYSPKTESFVPLPK